MLDIIMKGGPVMMLILLGSVIGLAIVLERAWAWWRLRLDVPRFTEEIFGLLQTGRAAQAIARCETIRHPVARLMRLGLTHPAAEPHELDRMLQHEGDRAIQQSERYLGGLSSIVTISPLLGFLGTIAGLIMSFRAWEQAGADVTVSDLAAGIYQAMLTTAAGLIVAIPLFLAYNYFVQRSKRLAFELTDTGNSFQRVLATTAREHAHASATFT